MTFEKLEGRALDDALGWSDESGDEDESDEDEAEDFAAAAVIDESDLARAAEAFRARYPDKQFWPASEEDAADTERAVEDSYDERVRQQALRDWGLTGEPDMDWPTFALSFRKAEQEREAALSQAGIREEDGVEIDYHKLSGTDFETIVAAAKSGGVPQARGYELDAQEWDALVRRAFGRDAA